MPEFAEVHAHVQWLQPRLSGFPIDRFTVSSRQHFKHLDGDSEAVARAFFEGNTIHSVSQRGKQIVFHTARGLVLSHLMFKGRWSLEGDHFTSHYHHHVKPPTSKSRTITLEGAEGTLGFYSPEYKAHIDVYPDVDDAAAVDALSKLGPDVLVTDLSDEAFPEAWSLEAFQAKAARSKQAIKPFLLDQKKQAGLGNMYVCESLYDAGVDPKRPANSLSAEECAQIHAAAVAIVQKAIDAELDYTEVLRIYKKATDPDGAAVQVISVGGRDSYWVPGKQR